MSEQDIINIMLKAVAESEAKHPSWPSDIIHASAIVAEESGELIQACLEHIDEGKPAVCIQKEAIHTLVTAFRLLKNFDITKFEPLKTQLAQ